MYSLLETNQDIDQFLKSIYRYIQIGVYIRGYQDKRTKHFHREIAEVTEFYVTEDNKAEYNTIYRKTTSGKVIRKSPSKYLIDYLDAQGVTLPKDIIKEGETIDELMVNPNNNQANIAQNQNLQNNTNINQTVNRNVNQNNFSGQVNNQVPYQRIINRENSEVNRTYQNNQTINNGQVYRQVPTNGVNFNYQDQNKA